MLPALTRKAVEWIAQRAEDARGGKPFFLYLPLASPHTPIAPSPEWQGRSGLNPYADFVMQTDDCVGRVLDALAEHALAQNTLVMFTSDNGCSPQADFPLLLAKGHNPSHIFRGHKADIWDGGHRIPLLVRWPGRVKAGSTSDQLVSLVDLTATCAELVGARLPDNAAEDSISMLSVLLGKPAVGSRGPRPPFDQRQVRDPPGPLEAGTCPGSGGWGGDPQATRQGLPPGSFTTSRPIRPNSTMSGRAPGSRQTAHRPARTYVAQGRSTPGACQTTP